MEHYYAVIFSSERSDDDEGYAETDARMMELAAAQPGFLGIESVHEGNAGISISYWESETAIRDWKQQVEHLEAQRNGRERWYRSYRVRVARVEREYGFGQE